MYHTLDAARISSTDPVVTDSVNGIQALTLGLSGKIWQKIMIFDLIGSDMRH